MLQFFKSPKGLAGAEREIASGERVVTPQDVPLAEIRPRGVEKLPEATDMTEEQAALMRAAHARIAAIHEGAAGRPFTTDEVHEIVKNINPTGGTRNCLECSLAVRENLLRERGAVVAGPTNVWVGRNPGPLGPVTRPLSVESRIMEGAPGISHVVSDVRANPGTYGILRQDIRTMPWNSHVYNVADLNGEVHFLDGQDGSLTKYTAEAYPDMPGFIIYDYYPAT
ncbi:toxin glutamine deamidase domain-containing protein [Actinoallomurus iriomotensis]|uniref:toxin glutamine deamidase domain-containing protein n=1 Tax=Actinoallomurus iriomotensis TaxID=478107 RepID=UPI0025541FE9|nr:toxin glutamine deamidase domain-containing protein [Actinoallomurus iriomotensis]